MSSLAATVPVGFCDNCGGRGHSAQICPSKRKLCFSCGTSGHIASSQCKWTFRRCGNCQGVGHTTNFCSSSFGGGWDLVSDFPEIKAIASPHCYWCGGSGHYVTWCPSRSSPSSGNPLCFRCGDESHTEVQCCSQVVARKCNMCQGVGHVKDCRNIACYVVVNCEKCGNEGHVDRECPKKSDDEFPAWRGYDRCATCGEEGHFTAGCQNYKA